ncbi:tetratricopeptide repeat protein [Sediminibacterium soli]|uniref:tetratricopeptide repeat protein n=1 Tax=Sediminibacterium soli TaxID=2698829 RepID=UPI00137B4A6B|nr:tetratricopeptide repeat protein [Sediminibacterium soli]NCI45826.1 tetratricopeptide repeat protein [Sediminibacterium soli]
MNRWIPVILLACLAACRGNQTKDIPADRLSPDEMPDNIRRLYTTANTYPDSPGLRMQLVEALDSLGASGQAIGQMDSLIRKDSLNYGFWYRKSMLQQATRDTAGALHSLRYAIRIYPAPDALLAAANLFAEKKDTTALYLARQVAAMRLGREYAAHTHFISGVYYARTGQRQKAIASFDNCIAADFNYMEAYMEKGFLYFDNKQVNEAAQVFKTVITIRNTYADGYYWLAKCQEALGNQTEAIDNYRRAVQLDPALKEAGQALARLEKK